MQQSNQFLDTLPNRLEYQAVAKSNLVAPALNLIVNNQQGIHRLYNLSNSDEKKHQGYLWQ